MYGEFILLTFSSHTKLVGGTLQKQDLTLCVCVCPTVSPLCFLYNEPSKLYSVFREMYIRYFFRLHSISSSPSVSSLVFVCKFFVCVFTSVHLMHMCFLQGIVSLCLQFERLLQTHLPQLFYHLRQIGAQPWVCTALTPSLWGPVHPRSKVLHQNYKITDLKERKIALWDVECAVTCKQILLRKYFSTKTVWLNWVYRGSETT